MRKILILSLFCLTLWGFACLPVGRAEQININTATLTQLDQLAGIGAVKAQAIIDNRPYSVDDLDRVKGIGPATIADIKAQGLACVDCASTQTISNYSNSPNLPNQIPSSNDQIQKTADDGLPSVSAVYQSGVYINEILPNPKGADETDEWIVPTIQLIPLAYL